MSLKSWSHFHRFAFFIGILGLIVAVAYRDVRGAVLMAFVTVSIVPEDVLSKTGVLIKYSAAGILAILVWYFSSGWLRWAFLVLGIVLIGHSLRGFVQKF